MSPFLMALKSFLIFVPVPFFPLPSVHGRGPLIFQAHHGQVIEGFRVSDERVPDAVLLFF
jgi:hypothetical protein